VSKLFIELYLDEDVDVLVADLLRARGFAVTTTVEAGQLHNDDDAQLAYAVTHDKAFLTHNRKDFEDRAQAYFAAGQHHPGIIIAVRRSPYDIAQRLLVMLNQVTADEMRDQVRYI
jgi:predicted nuclease of predicted toxin-antitoxin system